MVFYRHYSFDLWMTLIRSNPLFKAERANFFFKNFNPQKKTIEEVSSIFRKVDIMCNSINEKTGKSIDADEMYLMVISMMNGFDTGFTGIDLAWLYNEMESLLFKYMPVVYCDETFDSLSRIKERNNSSFSISSNTAFIKGATLRKVLTGLSLSPFFDFQLYSDEIDVSKPDRQFFECMVASVRSIPANQNISLAEIVHIGDNPCADIAGALSAGINGVQINSNNMTIQSLLT
jgi:putative hydrolase of the HAD superfamily